MTDLTDLRLRRASQAVGVCAALLLIVVLPTYFGGEVDRPFVDISMTTAALLGAANCALGACRAAGRLRAAWAGLAMACLSWGIGQAVWSWYELVQHTDTPFPGLADLAYLGFPVGAVIALTLFPANASHADRRRMTLDALLITSAVGLVSWATVLGAVVEAGGTSPFATAVSVAYPLSDIVLLVVCVLVLSRARAYRVPLAFVAVGLLMLTVADSGFAFLVATDSYSTGSMFDLGWFFAFGTLAFASLARGATSTQTPVQTPTVAGAVLPYIPLFGAFVFIAWRYATGHAPSTVEVVMTGVIVLLVLTRQFFTVRDNQKLALALAQTESELRHQAFHDPLTGLANRALFVDRLDHALELHRRDRRPLAICFLDLDGFKAVNDTLGHSAGDELLKGVSARFGEV
ncbi:MAG: GGDEF domain-containing protein, partial [Terracoccus sp.]